MYWENKVQSERNSYKNIKLKAFNFINHDNLTNQCVNGKELHLLCHKESPKCHRKKGENVLFFWNILLKHTLNTSVD